MKSSIFDTNTGTLLFENGAHLYGGMTPLQVVKGGLIIKREIDMQNGWSMQIGELAPLGAYQTKLFLNFNAGLLCRVSFTLLSDAGTSTDTLFATHGRFLRDELGEPNRREASRLYYDYDWGVIGSEVDPRNDSAYIIITWA